MLSPLSALIEWTRHACDTTKAATHRPENAAVLHLQFLVAAAASAIQRSGIGKRSYNPCMKTIIFDFGNVLGYFDHGLTLSRLAAHTDMTAEEMIDAIYRAPIEDDFEAGRIGAAEFLRQVKETCRLRCDEKYLAEAWSDIFRANQVVCDLVPHLKSRYRLLLGSNTNELHAGQFCRQFADTLSHFDKLVMSHQIGVRKPNAEFYQHCQAHAHGDPAECVFIDDLPANIAAARACGWHGIQYLGFQDLENRLKQLDLL